MERQTITVDIAPGNSQVERLGSSQGDIGRPLGVYIIQNGVALDCSTYSAELYILKPDGKFYTTQATVDSTETNLIKWDTAKQETPVAGACAAQIRIAAGDDDIGTARFVEFVEASPGDMGSASESEVALLTEYVRQARESATSAGRDATTASGAASSASGSASTATTAANTATQAATAATAAADRAEAVEESIPADYTQLSDDVTGLKSALVNFERAMQYVGYGVKQNGDVVFTAENVNEGDTLYYKVTASGTNGVAYLGFFDSSNVRLAYYGKGSGSSTVLTYEGTAEIPAGFSYCKVFTNNGLTLDINYLTIGEPLTAKIEELYNNIDSPFADGVPDLLKGIIAFNFIGNVLAGDVAYDVNDYEDFKVTNIYYKDTFYMYMPVQGYKNGAWTAYDSIEISLANAPTESAITILTSKYGRFQIAIIPSLMMAGRATGVDYRIKHSAVDPFFVSLRKQANQTVLDLGIGDFELQDHIAHIVTVKQDGSGDYTTIAAAYAAITDSSFLNQYEIVVYPGTYEEVNLICPNFSHTHGLAPNTVTVTSVGKSGTQPVFEQRNGNSKLSNMTIISGTGYCVHQDSSLNGFVLVNENLHCIKDYGVDVSNYGWQSKTNPSVVGDGAQYYGAKFIWRNCTFEDGEVACHSNSSSDPHANQHFVLENCRLVNARIRLLMAGNDGANPNSHCVAEIKGLYTPPGCQSLVYKLGARVDSNNPNFIWQIIGGENENFAVICDNYSDTQTVDKWDSINTTEKALVQISGAVTKGQWLKYDLSVCGADEAPQNVFGVALENGSSGDTIQVWIGNAFAYTATNGEYGIDVNGALSASATVKIGRVYKNIFYRY